MWKTTLKVTVALLLGLAAVVAVLATSGIVRPQDWNEYTSPAALESSALVGLFAAWAIMSFIGTHRTR